MKSWKEIPGWFEDEAFFEFVLKRLACEEMFCVEVGSWQGRSTACLAQAMQRLRQRGGIYAIDTWAGSDNEPFMQQEVEKAGGPEGLYQQFIHNLKQAGVADMVIALMDQSVRFADYMHLMQGKADFIFLDGNHTYEGLKADILAWRSNLRPGGILAGHDWPVYEGVRQAVCETLGQPNTMQTCWYFQI